MSNTVLVIDLILGLMETSARLNEILRKAQIENRDITDAELKEIREENRLKSVEFLSE